MLKYVIKRTLMLIPTLFIIVTLVFCLMRMVPGSPVQGMLDQDATPEEIEEMEEALGFNDPILEQYFRFLGGIITGDWGNSYFYNKPVFEVLLSNWEPSIIVAIMATIITVVVALPIGIISATRRNSLLDYTVTSGSMVMMSIPTICWCLLLSYFFAYKMPVFKTSGYETISRGGFWNSIYLLTLPALAIGLHHVASLVRYVRTTMLDVLRQDYIRTAKAKGLPQRKIYYKHAMKNTLSVTGTMIATSFAAMLGGTAVTEKAFAFRGLGTLAVDSLNKRDYTQEQAIVLFAAIIALGVNLLLDIFYKLLDPRIQYD